MAIGRNVDSGGGQWYFDGKLDDVAVWDTPLTCGQIAALAAGAAPDAGAGIFLVAATYWCSYQPSPSNITV